MFSKIVVYSKNNCVFCTKAKTLLKNLGFEYEERMMESFESPAKMIEDIGKNVRSMPQIKIDDELVGGYNQLVEFLQDKKLVNYKGEIDGQR
tara:strand:+ start:398 stop:673 length:276 start_codon:yes stop_codon:yes gene_type:complete